MATLLAKNAEILVTMDGQRRELKNAGIYIEDGFIKQVGRNEELPATAETVLDLPGRSFSQGSSMPIITLIRLSRATAEMANA
jgi:cytosine/adenosine deaminase-related metal-dependent hydrolase